MPDTLHVDIFNRGTRGRHRLRIAPAEFLAQYAELSREPAVSWSRQSHCFARGIVRPGNSWASGPALNAHTCGHNFSVSFPSFNMVQCVKTWQSMSPNYVQSASNPWYVNFPTYSAFYWLLRLTNIRCMKSIAFCPSWIVITLKNSTVLFMWELWLFRHYLFDFLATLSVRRNFLCVIYRNLIEAVSVRPNGLKKKEI